MPFDIADLWDETRSIDAEYKGHAFSIEFVPEKFDTRAVAAMSRYTQEADTFRRTKGQSPLPDPDPLVDALMRCVVGWGITVRGEPMPLTRENLAAFHFDLVTTIMGAINNDQGPSEKNGSSSPNGSPPAAGSGKRRASGTP